MNDSPLGAMAFSGKVALVTGAASGIGKHIAERLVGHGCRVVATDIDCAAGAAAAKDSGAEFLHHDITSEHDWETVFNVIRERHCAVDVVVNNAGIYAAGNVEHTTLDDWHRIMGVNAAGVFLGCKHAIAAMKERGGSIVNVSSGAALRPTSGAAAYSASKSAVWSLTRTTALHCAESGYDIRCNAVHPGMVDTPMVAGRAKDDDSRRELYEKCAALHPLGRMASVQDVAAAVIFLASDEARYLTGVSLPVDGGYAIA